MIVTRHADRIQGTINNFKAAAAFASPKCTVEHRSVDATADSAVEVVMADVRPDLIVNTASLLSWRFA
jgi:dTDP-4-dehydrorhamnose reductase